MARLQIEVHFLPDGTVNLVVPKQPGVDYEKAAPALAAYARSLSVELDLPVTVTSEPERHLHGPEQAVTFASRRAQVDHGHTH